MSLASELAYFRSRINELHDLRTRDLVEVDERARFHDVADAFLGKAIASGDGRSFDTARPVGRFCQEISRAPRSNSYGGCRKCGHPFKVDGGDQEP